MEQEHLKFELQKIHLDTLRNLVFQRYALIPVIASLSATILVIATFNQNIIPVTPIIKISLIILLIIIPFSLWDYLYENSSATNDVIKKLGLEDDVKQISKKTNLFKQIRCRSVYLYLLVTSCVIFAVIISIIVNW